MLKGIAAVVLVVAFGMYHRAKGDNAVKELEGIASEACACYSVECARGVAGKLSIFTKKHAETGIVPDQETKARETAEGIAKCLVSAGLPAHEIMAAVK